MIDVEGRVLPGLDEFMLRGGHLVVLTRVAHDMGASWRRIHREFAKVLSETVPVTVATNPDVAQYLAEKRLCRNTSNEGTAYKEEKFRYPDLEIHRLTNGHLEVRSVTPGSEVRVTWQDRSLADHRVKSRVGAITWSAKAGSKTGLSHVMDWAQLLELANGAGQLSPTGRLMVTLTGATSVKYDHWNPYILGYERIFLASEYFRRDLDIFARLAPRLLECKRLTKAESQELFVCALTEASKDAEKSRSVSSRHRFELHQQLRDLERSARRSDKRIEETSTAWHRAASRLETYTDLGLLEKGNAGEKEKYQYVYYPNDQLKKAVDTLNNSSSADAWLYQHLSEVILGIQSTSEPLDSRSLLSDLSDIVRALSLPTTLLPIYCLTLGLVYLHARRGNSISLHQARDALEAFPSQEPNIARLARGREGTRAEFLSVNLRKVASD